MVTDDRFWAKVDKSGECWLWTGYRGHEGYGRITRLALSPTPIRAHRYAWGLAHGTIPAGLWVLHKCDNPPCVNPAHLFLGTRSDNMRDAAQKGRLHQQTTFRPGKRALTPEQVVAVRQQYQRGEITQRDLGKRFGVSRDVVCGVLLRRGYADVV